MRVDPPGGLVGHRVGEDGDVAALPGRDLEGGDAFPGFGEAVAQLEGVGDQLLGGDRGDPQGDGEGFGGVGGDLGAALAAQRLVGQEGFAAPGGDTGLGGGGVEHGPLVGDEQLVPGGCAFAVVGVGEEVEQRFGVEVLETPVLLRCFAHGTSQAATTDTRPGPETPYSTGVLITFPMSARWLGRTWCNLGTARLAEGGAQACWAASAPKPPLHAPRGSGSRPPQASAAVP